VKIKIFHNKETNVSWVVRLIYQGQRYGRADSLVHDKPEPLVEFFDTRYEHTDLGQFVSRYYLKTLLKSEFHGRPIQGSGLTLDTGSDDWVIHESCYKRILQWLTLN